MKHAQKTVRRRLNAHLHRGRKRLVLIAEKRSSREGFEKTLVSKTRIFDLIYQMPTHEQGQFIEWANGIYGMLEKIDPKTLPERSW